MRKARAAVKKENPTEQKWRRIGEARDAFLKAAAALTQWPLERNAAPFALYQGALGMLRLAQADDSEMRNLGAAEEMIRACTVESGEP